MSKSITIPSGFGNPVVVVINGVKYIYPAGSTQTVPDEVAALLETNAEEAVIYGRHASAPMEAAGPLSDDDFISVYVDTQGNLKARKSDIRALFETELPAVTTDDNGDVLTVVSGAWAKAAPSGGGGGLVVHATEEEEDVYVLDKTWQEIYNAVAAGTSVVILMPPQVQGDPDRAFHVVFCGKHSFQEGAPSYYTVDIVEPVGVVHNPLAFVSETASGYPAVD